MKYERKEENDKVKKIRWKGRERKKKERKWINRWIIKKQSGESKRKRKNLSKWRHSRHGKRKKTRKKEREEKES